MSDFKILQKSVKGFVHQEKRRRKTNVSWFQIGKQLVLKDLLYDVSSLSIEKYVIQLKIIRHHFNKKIFTNSVYSFIQKFVTKPIFCESKNFKVKTSKKIQSCVLAYASTHKWFTCFDENEQHPFLNNRNKMETNCDIKQTYECKWQYTSISIRLIKFINVLIGNI